MKELIVINREHDIIHFLLHSIDGTIKGSLMTLWRYLRYLLSQGKSKRIFCWSLVRLLQWPIRTLRQKVTISVYHANMRCMGGRI